MVTSKTEKYSFVRLSKNNIKDLYDLFVTSSKYKLSYDKFVAKYNTQYTGVEYIGFFAFNESEKPVAYYGIVPCFTVIENQKVLIAQAVDAVTHPNHRRKGLFEKIVSLTTELATKEGVHFIFGVPNDLSYQGFIKKFNWSQNGNLVKFTFKIFQFPISYFFKQHPTLNKFYQFWIGFTLSFYKKAEIFKNPNNKGNNICILRDDPHFKYKNYSRKYLIQMCNTSIWFSIDGAMKIGDIKYSENINLRQLMKNIKFLAFMLGVRKIIFQFSPSAFWVDKMKIHYHAEESLPLIYSNISHLYDPKMLTISFGDIDTF